MCSFGNRTQIESLPNPVFKFDDRIPAHQRDGVGLPDRRIRRAADAASLRASRAANPAIAHFLRTRRGDVRMF